MPPLKNTHFPTSSLSYHPYPSPVPVLLPQYPSTPSQSLSFITQRIFNNVSNPGPTKPKRQRKKPLPPSSLSRQTPLEALRAANPESSKPPFTGDLQTFSISALPLSVSSAPNTPLGSRLEQGETRMDGTSSDAPHAPGESYVTALLLPVLQSALLCHFRRVVGVPKLTLQPGIQQVNRPPSRLSIDTSLSVFKTSPPTPKSHPHSAPASGVASSDDSTPIASPLGTVPLPPSATGEASSSRTTIEELEQRDWARYLAVVKTREPVSTEVLSALPKSASTTGVPSPSTGKAEDVSVVSPPNPRSAKTPKPGDPTPSPKLDLEQFWVSHWPPRNEREGMFDNIQAMFGGGAGVGTAGMVSLGVQAELQQLKLAPVLNPHFGMVIKYLDCLNRLMDGLVMSMGPSGVTPWLVEVQTLIRLLQKRIFQRMPLTLPERTALMNFAAYWRQMVQPPYAMGRPEAQLVLITLTELASR